MGNETGAFPWYAMERKWGTISIGGSDVVVLFRGGGGDGGGATGAEMGDKVMDARWLF